MYLLTTKHSSNVAGQSYGTVYNYSWERTFKLKKDAVACGEEHKEFCYSCKEVTVTKIK